MSLDRVTDLVAQAREAGAKPAEGAEASVAQRQKLAQIAAEFESMLLGQMLRDMRKSGSWDDEREGGEQGMGLGAESMFETIDTELVSHLSKAGGLGLGRELLKSLNRNYDEVVKPGLEMTMPDPAIAAMGQRAAFDKAVDKAVGTSGVSGVAAAAMRGLGDLNGDLNGGVDGGTDAPAALAGLSVMAGLRPETAAVAAAGFAGVRAVKAPRLPEAAATATMVEPGYTSVKANLTPVRLEGVTSDFGWRRDPLNGHTKFHRGVDLKAAYGQEVRSAADGRIVFEGTQRGYGNTVVVEHANGVRTRYAHLSSSDVQEGQTVAAGQFIGRAGRSGRATGTHLHFEVTAGGRPIDPEAWLAGQTERLKAEDQVADLAVVEAPSSGSRGDRHED